MAIATNAYLTYSAVGNREDLSDVIYNISPEETPFINSIGKGKADAKFHEWQTDALASAATNAQLEGDDSPSATAVTPTVRVGNRCQISRKIALVSGTQEAVSKAGRKSEMAYQLAKMGAELKRDMEKIVIGTAQGALTGNSTTASTLASMLGWVKSNSSKGVSGVDPDWTSGAPAAANLRTDGTQRSFTETLLKAMLSAAFTSGSDMSLLFLGATQKGIMSGFSGIATRYRDVGSKQTAQIIGAADVYVGDFHTLKVIPNRFQRDRDAWGIDPRMASIDYLRPFQRIELAQTGDAQKIMLLAEYTLKVNNEAAHGIVADLG